MLGRGIRGPLLVATLGEWSMLACLSRHLYFFFLDGGPLEMLMAPEIAELLMTSLERVEQL